MNSHTTQATGSKTKCVIPGTFFLLLLTAFLFSCGTAKNGKVQKDPTVELLKGTVHIVENCGTLIYTKIGKNNVVIYPNDLLDEFHVDGLKIEFFYKNSSIPVPKGCTADARGNVEGVSIVH